MVEVRRETTYDELRLVQTQIDVIDSSIRRQVWWTFEKRLLSQDETRGVSTPVRVG